MHIRAIVPKNPKLTLSQPLINPDPTNQIRALKHCSIPERIHTKPMFLRDYAKYKVLATALRTILRSGVFV